MHKEKEVLERLEKESIPLYNTLLNMLKTIKAIIKILKKTNEKEKFEQIVGGYQEFYVAARRIKILLITLYRDIKKDDSLEKDLIKAECDLDDIVGPKKTWQPFGKDPFQKTSLPTTYAWYGYIKKNAKSMGKGAKYENIIRDLRELSSIAFIVYRAWHGGQAVTGMEIKPTKNEVELPAKYKQILDELDSLGLTNLHYRMSTYAAEVIIRTKRIITLLEIDKKYKKKISDELEGISRMFRYEITLLEKNFGKEQVIKQTRALKKKLQELEALI